MLCDPHVHSVILQPPVVNDVSRWDPGDGCGSYHCTCVFSHDGSGKVCVCFLELTCMFILLCVYVCICVCICMVLAIT